MGQGAASLLHSPNASSYTSLESFISYFPFPLSTVIPPKFNPEPHKYGCALITWQHLPTTALCCPKSHCKLLYMGCFHLYFAVVLFNGRKVSFPLLSIWFYQGFSQLSYFLLQIFSSTWTQWKIPKRGTSPKTTLELQFTESFNFKSSSYRNMTQYIKL